jgi:hypothetical protein
MEITKTVFNADHAADVLGERAWEIVTVCEPPDGDSRWDQRFVDSSSFVCASNVGGDQSGCGDYKWNFSIVGRVVEPHRGLK